MPMKLSAYAKQVGVTSKTAWKWWHAGQLVAYQLPTGTVIVREGTPEAAGRAHQSRIEQVMQQVMHSEAGA